MFEIITAIEIEAPPERVWEQIIDLQGWSQWHPYMSFESGEVRQGAILKTVTVTEEQVYQLDTEVTSVGPGMSFCWTGEVHEPAYAKGVHRFSVEANGHGSILHQTERVTGPLVETEHAELMHAKGKAGFDAANQALKSWLETQT